MIPDISKFIDIHTHILPDIDDGPQNMEESASMARCYVALGIHTIIATPHFIPGTAWAANREKVRQKTEEVQTYFNEQNIALKLHPGMEIAYHGKLMARLEKGILQSLANSNYYLLEPSFQDSQYDLLQCARQFMEQGHKVIMAHPERIQAFQKKQTALYEAIQSGLEVQLNSGSLLGKFGEVCKETAMKFIAAKSVHYLASDAHSVENRKPLDVAEWKQINDILGDKLHCTLCIDNPQKITMNAHAK